jgi:hypothetical protein
VQVEIFCRADAHETAAVAAEAMLGFLIQSKDAPRVGQEDFAMLGQGLTPRVLRMIRREPT